MSRPSSINILLVSVFALVATSCSNSVPETKKATTDSAKATTYATPPEMSAKERLVKNNILEKHLSWKAMQLVGKVRTITSVHYRLMDQQGKTVKLPDTRKTDHFDINGNLVASEGYKGDTLDSKFAIMYDANGNDTLSIFYGRDGKVNGMMKNKYDSRGNETAEGAYQADERPSSRREYSYDRYDNLITISFYNDNQQLENRATFQYDQNGFKTGGDSYDAMGKHVFSHASKFDDKGNQLTATIYKEDGTVGKKYVFKYDDKDHRVETDDYGPNGALNMKWTSRYDDKGNHIADDIYKADGTPDPDKSDSRELVYDKAGNIIKETKYIMKNGKRVATEITEYQVTYY